MRKILFGTTAMVTALLANGVAFASEPLKLGVSGVMQQWFGVVNQESDGTAGTNGHRTIHNTGINTDTWVGFIGETTLDNGLTAHAEVKLAAWRNGGTGPDAAAGTPQAGRVSVIEEWASLAGGWGTLRAGVKESTNLLLHHEAADVGMGYADVAMWTISPQQMQNTGNATFPFHWLPWGTTSFDGPFGAAPSLAYITPKFFGLTAAVSYMPAADSLDATFRGPLVGVQPKQNVRRDYIDATLAYNREIGPVTLGLDGGYGHATRGASPNSTVNTVNIWEGGASIAYAGFTLGGAYMNMNDKAIMKGYSWNSGLSYDGGVWGVSALYFEEIHRGQIAVRGDDRFSTWLLSGKYNLGPGVDVKSSFFYAEYAGEVSSDVNNTYGYGLVNGIELTF